MPTPRALGICPWKLPPGAQNSLCDVPGVKVGHATVRRDAPAVIRSGITVIVPPGDLPKERLSAAGIIFNGTGELTGLHQINEWGMLETPIALTGTAAVPNVLVGLMRHLVSSCPDIGRTQTPPLPVVAECNDMYLNDSRAEGVQPGDVAEALRAATGSQLAWGSVGAGTGMTSFGFKGGVGTASRIVEVEGEAFTFGALCLINFGAAGDLVVGGQAVGHLPGEIIYRAPKPEVPDGSLVAVYATDAPIDHLGLRRIAQRGPLGMARVGSYGRHGSGDLFLAFATGLTEIHRSPSAYRGQPVLRQDALNPFFQAAVEATEEAVLHGLFMAETTHGARDHTVYALPVEEVLRKRAP